MAVSSNLKVTLLQLPYPFLNLNRLGNGQDLLAPSRLMAMVYQDASLKNIDIEIIDTGINSDVSIVVILIHYKNYIQNFR